MFRNRLAFFAAAVMVAGPTLADEVGQEIYLDYCAACHGTDGHGAGELAGLLSVAVPDLTTIAAENDGDFPMLKVIHIIDGRTGIRAHGGPMPVFGALFSAPTEQYGPMASETITRGRILSIAYYLESIQRAAE